MIPSSSSPKLPAWIFIVAWAALLLTAWYIASRSAAPLSPKTVLSVVACVVIGAVIGTIPLVIHYEREKNEALDDRQRALEALASTVASSAEQISIAAQGLHEIAGLAQRNLRQAEQLPAQLQAKITEFQTLLANAREEEREELKKEVAQLRASESDRLEAIADKVDHAAAELTKLEAAAQKHLAAAQAALAQAPEALAAASKAALAEIEAKLEARAASATPPPAAAPAGAEATEPVVKIEPVAPSSASPFTDPLVAGEAPAASAAAAPPAAEPKPVRKRAPRKPKPVVEAPAAALSLGIEEPAAAPAPADEFSQSAPDETPGPGAGVIEKVIASDGATRLLVTAYIGIGNRLFIRGDGPGLSWDKGVPLQFVSIGKWRWETAETTGPVKFKLYKNDETECTALGSQTLDPGHQEEVNATF
jgi:hypothetical protein